MTPFAPKIASKRVVVSPRRPSAAPVANGDEIAPGYFVVAHMRRGRRLDTYDVWSVERSCRCVAKTLRPERAGDKGAMHRLEQEHGIVTELTHPHLARGYELTRTIQRPRPVLILETLPGHTLDRLIADRGRIGGADTAMLGLQLCSALSYLHRHGWLHLDVKPSNVICSDARAVLLDLSVAERIGAKDVGGTFEYMAPEQARGDAVEEAADVWGVGLTLYESVVGSPAFEGREIDTGESSGDYPQLARRARRLEGTRCAEPSLAAAIDACLDPAAERRPSVESLARRLAAVAGVDPMRAGVESAG